MRYLPLLFIILFASCRSTKVVERTRIVTDSTATEQVKMLEKRLDSTVASYEKKLSEVSETGVVFETEPCPCDTLVEDPVLKNEWAKPRDLNTVHFNPNGSLKSASGNIKSVNVKTEKILQENADLKQVITTLRDSLASKKVELVKDEKQVSKDIERGGFQWFWLCVGLVGGFMIRWKVWPWVRGLFAVYKNMK